MKSRKRVPLALVLTLAGGSSLAGPVNPDCGVEKTAKHAVEQTTTGHSTNRCSPANAVSSADKNTPHPLQNAKDDNRRSTTNTAKDRTRDDAQH